MIDLSVSGGVPTLTAAGDLDLAERARFPELTERVTSQRPALVVVDLCSVGFVDSAGAAFLIRVAELTRHGGGRTVLRGANDQVLFVLEVCGALDSFEVDRDHRCPPAAGPGPWRGTRARGPDPRG